MNDHNIIIVDDDTDFITIMKTFFTWYGFNITDFTDPLLALEYYRCNGDLYSLIILDWKMPCMNGLILATQIRQINKVVKLLMITAYNIFDIKEYPEYESVKFEQILQKPVRMSELKEVVNNLFTV